MEFISQMVIGLDKLHPFPGNARRGDTGVIAASLAAFGQYRSLVVRQDGDGWEVIAGNHTAAALGQLLALTYAELEEQYGQQAAEAWSVAEHAARCEVIACDDDEARRINAADNRTAELGGYDDMALREQLQLIAEHGGLFGTGWTEADLSRLTEEQPPPDGFGELGPDLPTDFCCPSCGYEWSGKPK